jgi:hypothetical protein
VTAGMSIFARHGDTTGPALERLRVDLASGEWRRRNADLVDLEELDLGYRILST